MPMFRSRILPAIVAIWGAAVVIRLLVTDAHGEGAYGAGQYAAGLFGVVMVVAGLRAVFKARASS
jgi:hypothetical protein